MASRTSASTGMIVSLSIFALLFVVFFVISITALAKSQRLDKQLTKAEADLKKAVVVNSPQYDLLASETASGQGVVDLLLDRQLGLLQTMLGPGDRSYEQAAAYVASLEERTGGSVPSLASHIDALANRLRQEATRRNAAEDRLRQVEAARDAALQERDAIREQFKTAQQSNEREVQDYGDSVTEQREAYLAAKQSVETQLAEQIRRHQDEKDALQSSLQEAEQTSVILEQLVEELRLRGRSSELQAPDEATLVDGRIARVDAPSNQVFLSLGRRDRLVLGLTFEVYDDATEIRPNAEGDYPPGKATIEVIRIDEGLSAARILRENQGTPVVAGDVVVNPIYDPRKTYRFAVFGNFDTNGDAYFTEAEADDVRGIITEWGGVLDEQTDGDADFLVNGDTDFIVLGSRPVPPPKPKSDAPVEVILRFAAIQRKADEYDSVRDLARRASIPTLNINRLFTLTGLYSRR